MSKSRQAQSVPIEIPYRGMSTRYPLAKMPPEFCPWLEGYQLGAGFFESPKGAKYAFAGEVGTITAFAQDPVDPSEIVHFSQNGTLNARAYDVFAESSGATDTGSTGAGEMSYTFGFGSNTIICQNGAAPHTWSGSSLDVMTFTGPTLANIIGGTSHNEQLYVFSKEDSKIWFRDAVQAITGAMTSYDTSFIAKGGGKVMAVFTFTLSSALDAQNLLGIALDSGEVVICSGFDPADVTWQVLGRPVVGRPLGYNNFIEKDGDVLLLTTKGVVSMRSVLLSQEPSQGEAALSGEIEKYWQQLVKDLAADAAAITYAPDTAITSYIRGVWHQEENRLYIFCPKALEPYTSTDGQFGYKLVTGTMILIYDFNYQGWSVRRFSSNSDIPGGEAFKVAAVYYEPKTAQIYFSTTSTVTDAAWTLKGNSRFSDNVSAPTVVDTSSTEGGTADTETYPLGSSWVDENNALSSDGAYAVCALPFSLKTNYLVISNFGFAIPTGSNIVGVTITSELKASSTTDVLSSAELSNGDIASATELGVGTSDVNAVVGGQFIGFGESLTVAEVNDSSFSVKVRYEATSSSISVDAITVVVHYVEDLADNDSNIPLEVISAPLKLTDNRQQIKGWKIQQSGDTFSKAQLSVQSQGDIANKLTSATSYATLPAGVSKEVYNAGISADLIQYKITGATTKDDDRPHRLLSIAPLIEVGGEIG